MISPETIRNFRKRHKLSQEKMACLCGVSRETIRAKWEVYGIDDSEEKKSLMIALLSQYEKVYI